jgi:hypothetical protein
MIDWEEIKREHKIFLKEWQDIIGPSSYDTFSTGYLSGYDKAKNERLVNKYEK